jgi:hypothetical protein
MKRTAEKWRNSAGFGGCGNTARMPFPHYRRRVFELRFSCLSAAKKEVARVVAAHQVARASGDNVAGVRDS